MMMEPEKLKVIAEGMGYLPVEHPSPSRQGDVQMYSKINDVGMTQYNPTTIAEQDSEIELKLNIQTSYQNDKKNWIASIWQGENPRSLLQEEGETPAEARCNAAFEYFNNGAGV